MKNQIIVYADKGVGPASLRYLCTGFLNLSLFEGYSVVRFGEQQLREDRWQDKTALIVFPGGQDIYYHKALAGAPNRSFVSM